MEKPAGNWQMDRLLIILKKENGPRASSALTLGLNTIILKHVYWYTYMQQISGERLQDHWSSGSIWFTVFPVIAQNLRILKRKPLGTTLFSTLTSQIQ